MSGWRPIAEHDGSEGPFDLWRDGERLTDFRWRTRGLAPCWQKEVGYPSRTLILTEQPSHFMPVPSGPA